MFPDFFALWLLELAERHSAIIVSPDHRLLPEARVNDILDDVEDSWKWVQTKLAGCLESKTAGRIKPDMSRIMTAGESAGGLLSLILSLSHSDKIRATTAAYPMVDLKDRWYTKHFEKHLFDAPMLPESIYTEHVAKIKAREATASKDGETKKVVISADPRFERGPLMFVMFQQGLFTKYIDENTNRAFPLERLQAGEKFPTGGVFIWHGEGDSVVPTEESRKLVRKIKDVQPDVRCTLAERPGDHGFDGETKLDEQWMKDGMDPLVKAWLK